MAEIALRFELAKNTDIDQAADAIRDRLSALEAVSQVDTFAEKPRITGLEVVGAIAVTVEIVRGATELIEQIRKLIPQLKGLIGDIKGLKDVTVEVGPKRVPVTALTDDQVRQLADEKSGA